jgi:thymidylate synthase (FAD)
MKVIEQYHVIEHITPNILQQIERCARNCYKSEDKITEDSAEKMVKALIKKNHGAMLEFGDIIVRFVTNRGVTHELVRHRLCSFAQESTRYVRYDGQMEFIRPVWCPEDLVGSYLKWEDAQHWVYKHKNQKDNMQIACWLDSCINDEQKYIFLLDNGWRPEQAREILPNSLKTEIVVKGNIREWRHMFTLRCSKKAHPQIRSLFTNLLIDLKKQIPVVFDDIGGENG